MKNFITYNYIMQDLLLINRITIREGQWFLKIPFVILCVNTLRDFFKFRIIYYFYMLSKYGIFGQKKKKTGTSFCKLEKLKVFFFFFPTWKLKLIGGRGNFWESLRYLTNLESLSELANERIRKSEKLWEK